MNSLCNSSPPPPRPLAIKVRQHASPPTSDVTRVQLCCGIYYWARNEGKGGHICKCSTLLLLMQQLLMQQLLLLMIITVIIITVTVITTTIIIMTSDQK